MADGEMDIDPDAPTLDQQKQDITAKVNAIIDAIERDAINALKADQLKFAELAQKLKRSHVVTMIGLVVFDVGLLFCALAVFINFNNIQETSIKYHECIGREQWTSWEPVSNQNYYTRSRCGHVQYNEKSIVCPDCMAMASSGYISTFPEGQDTEGYAYCADHGRFVKKQLD